MPERKPHYSTLEEYKKMPVFIPVETTEDMVNSIAWKLYRSAGTGGTDSEYLQEWLLKFGYHIK